MSSHLGAGRALALGFENVWIMPEGVKGWADRGYPLVRAFEPLEDSVGELGGLDG